MLQMQTPMVRNEINEKDQEQLGQNQTAMPTKVTQLQPKKRILSRTEVWVCGAGTEVDTDPVSFTLINEHTEVVTMHDALKITTNCPSYQMSWGRKEKS